jgi:hypothetical protein
MDFYIAIIIYSAIYAKSKQIFIVKWRVFVYCIFNICKWKMIRMIFPRWFFFLGVFRIFSHFRIWCPMILCNTDRDRGLAGAGLKPGTASSQSDSPPLSSQVSWLQDYKTKIAAILSLQPSCESLIFHSSLDARPEKNTLKLFLYRSTNRRPVKFTGIKPLNTIKGTVAP